MRHHKGVEIVLSVIILLVLFCAVDVWASYHWLAVRYTAVTIKKESVSEESGLPSGPVQIYLQREDQHNVQIKSSYPDSMDASAIHICVISDLHNAFFGSHNKKLVQKIAEQSPDLILMAGDMLNQYSRNDKIPITLVEQLVNVAPVYYALGNHEIAYIKKNGDQLLWDLKAAGARIVEKNYFDTTVRGQQIRIGGMYEYAFGNTLTGNFGSAASSQVKSFLKDFDATSRMKIMICHRPDSFIFGDAATYWHPDLVISGHDHGGQVVLPFLGGLFGGDQGFFPKYIHGLYPIGKTQIFITSGLGSHTEALPRFNNRPEIAMLEIREN